MESVNFDRAAEYYDETRALSADVMAELLGVLITELAPAQRQPCLEIGVGTGRIALPLHEQGVQLAGADIAEAMLRRLVVNAEGVAPFPLLLADATRLPVADGAFGSVLAVHVLHLIPTWRDAVEEAMRVLRPGGALIASFPGGDAYARRKTGAAPWRSAVRDALARHGVVRAATGARVPQDVASYLGERAVARMLPPVPVTETQTLAGTVRDIEQQVYSWTWPYSRQQVLAAGADIRAWAAGENVSLDQEHLVEGSLEWWSFEVPALPGFALAGQGALDAVEGDLKVVAADEIAGRMDGQPAQRGVRALRTDSVRGAGRHEVPQVGMLMGGLPPASGDVADHDVPEPGVRPRFEVRQACFLSRLAQRDLQRVALPRVTMPADLEPPALPLVPAQQHPAAVGVHDQRGSSQVQRSIPRPRSRIGRKQCADPHDVGRLGLPRRLIAVKPVSSHPVIVPSPPGSGDAVHLPFGIIAASTGWLSEDGDDRVGKTAAKQAGGRGRDGPRATCRTTAASCARQSSTVTRMLACTRRSWPAAW